MFTWVAECVYVGCDRSQVSGSHKDPHPCPCNSTWFQSRPLETSQWCARFVSYNLNSNFSARQWWTAMNYKSLRMTHDRHISTVLHAFCCSCNHQFLLWKQVSLATTSVCRSSISRKGHSLCLLQIPNTVHYSFLRMWALWVLATRSTTSMSKLQTIPTFREWKPFWLTYLYLNTSSLVFATSSWVGRLI